MPSKTTHRDENRKASADYECMDENKFAISNKILK